MDAKALADWQARHGLTQVAAARALGVAPQTYRHWLADRIKVPAPIAKLTRYIDRYGVLDD